MCAGDTGHRVVRITALLLGLAATFSVVWWGLRREESAAAAPGAIGSESAEDKGVRLAPDVDRGRSKIVAASIALAKAAEPENRNTAEDRNLGQAIVRPKDNAAAPPAPPRASVDPESEAPDDPGDFEPRVR